MTDFRTLYHYNLSKITEFNLALIYGFEPEASIKSINPSFKPDQYQVEHLSHGVNQHEDMFIAYYYAQETILKSIREHGIESITTSQILNWIKEIHQRISLALSEDTNNINLSGNYTMQQVIRWHHNPIMGVTIQHHFLGINSKEKMYSIAEEYGLEIKIAENFLQILHDTNNRDDITIFDDERPFIDPYRASPLHPALVATTKLCNAYHQKKLTQDEMVIVDKVMKICCPPSQIPEKMSAFAVKLEAGWKQCDKNDLNQVAELCRMTFFELTDIHPFFNANGRTATCLINIILRSLGYESILMRNPGDKSNKSSSYSIAMQYIDSNPELLRAHLISRIRDANNKIIYKNEILEEIIQSRLELTKTCAKFKLYFPLFDLLDFWNKTCKEASEVTVLFLKQNQIEYISNEEITILVLAYINLHFSTKLKELEGRYDEKEVIASIIQRQYSELEKQSCLEKIKDLTGLTQWKSSNHRGLTIILESNDSEYAEEITKSLKKVDAFKVTLKVSNGPMLFIISINQINPVKLLKLEQIPGIINYAKYDRKMK